MDSISSSEAIISNFKQEVETLFNEILTIATEPHELSDANSFESLERSLHEKVRTLADNIAGLKLQEHLNSEATQASTREFVKSQPGRLKDMGKRQLTIRLLGGTQVKVISTYYHRKATVKKHQGRRGYYPSLLLLGIHHRYSPGLASLTSLLATAACSFNEASLLLKETLNVVINVKAIRRMVKYFGTQARLCQSLDNFERPDDFTGRLVATSMDGGRVRIRKNKRGKKTAKRRSRYNTDWKEPKLIIIYLVGEDGQQERKSLPLIDASLSGPDETFSLLIYYLKKLQVSKADLLLFVSDGAKWIWERAKTLSGSLGLPSSQCFFALDYYHAVEHLSVLANKKRWTKKERQRWVNKQKKRLLSGKLEQFMDDINSVCKGTKSDDVKRERLYFENHLPHLRYAELKTLGLPIGSGAVESGIRRVINLRLKGPGIFWHEDMADAILMLRSYYKAGRWDLLKNMALKGAVNMQ